MKSEPEGPVLRQKEELGAESRKDLSPFCTCRDLSCPFHPTNHDRGCAPCIAKNLNRKEIPSCFFHLVEKEHSGDGYGFEDFAKSVLRGGDSPDQPDTAAQDGRE